MKNKPVFVILLMLIQSALSACMVSEEPAQEATESADSQMKINTQTISPVFPYEKQFVEVKGARMAYVDEGEGPLVLFLHGNPTSSYLWRNIIPYVSDTHRAIAVDLIGMGDSDKPDIEYTFEQHAAYLDAFISALDLKNITLVIHDWGSVLGMRYARLNEDNVQALAFMEALVPPAMPMGDYDAWGDSGEFIRQLHTPDAGEGIVLERNFFIEVFLSGPGTARSLSEEELNAYRAPFPDVNSRKPILAWARELPIEGRPTSATSHIVANGEWLKESKMPKLLFYLDSGGTIRADAVNYFENNLHGLKTVNVGKGGHFLQEDKPHLIGEKLSDWLEGFNS